MKKPVILLVSPILPYPPTAGNEIRLLKMIAWLRAQGFHIALLANFDVLEESVMNGVRQAVDDVYLRTISTVENAGAAEGAQRSRSLECWLKRALARVGLYNLIEQKFFARRAKKKFCPPSLVSTTARLCRELGPVAVIAEYAFTAPCLDVVERDVLKIIDTHDMYSRRNEQVMAYGIRDPLFCSREEERSLLLKGDVIVAIQETEAEMFRELLPERKVITVGIDFPVIGELEMGDADKDTILVVGSDNRSNIHGLKEFLSHAWPMIASACPRASLKVVGKLGNYLPASDGNIVTAGWVPDLNEEYAKATVVINPIQAGTGLKIKSVEALCRGKALVATPNAVEGILFEGEPPFITCYEWENFALAVLELLNSEERRRSLEKKARYYALNEFAADKVYAPLQRILAEYMGNSFPRLEHEAFVR